MAGIPRNPREARQFRKPRAQHLSDVDVRKIDDEKTLDALLGLDDPAPSSALPSAHEAVEQALEADSSDSGLPNILAPEPSPAPPAESNANETVDVPALPDIPDIDDTPLPTPPPAVDSVNETFEEPVVPSDAVPAVNDVGAGEADVSGDPDSEAITLDDFLEDFGIDDGATDQPSSDGADNLWADEVTPEPEEEEIDDDFVAALWASLNETEDAPEDSESAAPEEDEDVLSDILAEDFLNSLDTDDDDDNDFEDEDDDEDDSLSLSDFLEANYWDEPSEDESSSQDSEAPDESSTYQSGWGELAAMMEDEAPDTSAENDTGIPDDAWDTEDSLPALGEGFIDDDSAWDTPTDHGDDEPDDDILDALVAARDTGEEDEEAFLPDVEEDMEAALPTLSKEPEADDEHDDEPDEDEDEDHEPLRFVMPPILSPIKGLFGLLGKVYTAIVKIFFKILIFVLDILAMLPIVGRFIAPLKSMTQLLERIAMALPIVFVLGIVLLFWWFSVPSSHNVELPDLGEAEISSFVYDSDTGDVTAEVENTGEVIANVDVEFTIKSLQPTWNPVSWVVFEDAATCSTSVEVEITDTAEVHASCDSSIDGFFPRATGELVPTEQ